MSGRSARLVSGPYQLVFVGKYLEAAAVKITCAQKNYHQTENRQPSPSSALMMKFDWVQLRALQLWPDRPGCVIIWGVSLPVSQINSIQLKRKKWRDELWVAIKSTFVLSFVLIISPSPSLWCVHKIPSVWRPLPLVFSVAAGKKKYLKLPQLITSCVSQDFPKVEPTHHHFPSLSSHGY